MKTSIILASLFLSSLSVVACAAEVPTDGDVAAADSELVTAGIQSIEIGRSTGFAPPPPAGSCRASGRYTIGLDTSTIKGAGCIDGKSITVERALSSDEV